MILLVIDHLNFLRFSRTYWRICRSKAACGVQKRICIGNAIKRFPCACNRSTRDVVRKRWISFSVVTNIEVLTGDHHVLTHVSGVFNHVVANINRNILLSDMASMVDVLSVGGRLTISGFFESDVDVLKEEAERLGLTYQSKMVSGDWAALSFTS